IAVSALLDSINPCAFSVLLLTIAFLVSIGRLRSSIMLIGGSYIAGLFAVYFLIGVGLIQALHLFSTPHFMAKIGAGLLLVLGTINVLSSRFPSLGIAIRLPSAAHAAMARWIEHASMPTAFALGGLVGLCEFPCTGGPYLTAVGLLHDNATAVSGIGYLLLYNGIFILPLVIILLMAGDRKVIERFERWEQNNKRNLRFGTGIAMVLLGILIFIF
ncbi:MAG: cytochrome c biogenesis protein CcdA, partial [Patescibacteria group bacterium]